MTTFSRAAPFSGDAASPTQCSHRPPCPGCPRFAEPGIAVAALGALSSLARAHGLPDVTVHSGPMAGFRLRARLAIRGRVGSPKLGLFELGTHRVVHIPNCSIHHPLINRVAGIVRRALVETDTSCFSDAPHLGLARYLQVVVERGSQSAQVVLVANSATPEPLSRCLDLIRERLGVDLHSLWFCANTERANTILGPEFERWCGPPAVVERFGGAQVHYPPGAFGQSNPDIAAVIIDHVRSKIPEGARVAEFYAGVGAIGLSVLSRCSALAVNEVAPHSLAGLELGLAQLDASERVKVVMLPGEAGAARTAASDADVVIVDPPRKGLDPELTAFVCEHPPERFIYVSCGLDSLLADSAQLMMSGRLRLSHLATFNLMPFTDHVETVAIFDRT